MFKKFRNEGFISEKIDDSGWNWGIVNNDKNIGKYIIMKDSEEYSFASTKGIRKELDTFVQNNTGEIVLSRKSAVGISYLIKYENIPDNLKEQFKSCNFLNDEENIYLPIIKRHNKIEFIGSKEECEIKISTKKYNI